MLCWLTAEHRLGRSRPRHMVLRVSSPQHQDLSLQSAMVGIRRTSALLDAGSQETDTQQLELTSEKHKPCATPEQMGSSRRETEGGGKTVFKCTEGSFQEEGNCFVLSVHSGHNRQEEKISWVLGNSFKSKNSDWRSLRVD